MSEVPLLRQPRGRRREVLLTAQATRWHTPAHSPGVNKIAPPQLIPTVTLCSDIVHRTRRLRGRAEPPVRLLRAKSHLGRPRDWPDALPPAPPTLPLHGPEQRPRSLPQPELPARAPLRPPPPLRRLGLCSERGLGAVHVRRSGVGGGDALLMGGTASLRCPARSRTLSRLRRRGTWRLAELPPVVGDGTLLPV